MLGIAPFQIVMWQTKKRGLSLSRFVSADNLGGAISIARQWVCWSHEAGRGKRPKFDRYRVEALTESGEYQTVKEGDLADAQTYQASQDTTETAPRDVLGSAARQEGQGRNTRRTRIGASARPTSRLAQLVAQVKQT